MAVTLVGSPGTAQAATAAIVGAYGQAPTTGNLLVAVLAGTGFSLANFTVTQTSGTTGWARLIPGVADNNSGGTDHCGCDVWWKAAGASEPAPGFTLGLSSTIVTVCVIFELAGANTTTPYDTSGIYQSGNVSLGAAPTMTPTTAGNVAAASEFAVSAFVEDNQSSTTVTWTELGTGWTNAYTTASTGNGHAVVNYQAAPTSGATLSDSGHFSAQATNWAAALVAVVAVSAAATNANAGLAASTGAALAPALGWTPALAAATGAAGTATATGGTAAGLAAAAGAALGEDDSAATGKVSMNMTIQGV